MVLVPLRPAPMTNTPVFLSIKDMRLLYIGFGLWASTMYFVMKTRPANPLWKRLQRQWRAKKGFHDAKTHQVDWVWESGVRLKRVRFENKQQAQQVAHALEVLENTGCFPPLIRHTNNEVWVGYIKKTRFSPLLSTTVEDFFSRLYGHQLEASSAIAPTTVVLASMVNDLRALTEQGLLGAPLAEQVDKRAHQIAPPIVVCGMDYLDAVKKNFVVSNGQAIGIDVEAILAEQWLGLGLAKAHYREIVDGTSVIEQLKDERMMAQYPLIRLAFLLQYFVQKMAQGKRGHIRLTALTELV